MSGLDPIGRREVRDLIQSLKDEGKTIFFSTHILSDAETLCDRVAVLNKGELRGIGVVAELVTKTAGKSEIVLLGEGARAALETLGASCHQNRDVLRAVIAESELGRPIDITARNTSRF